MSPRAAVPLLLAAALISVLIGQSCSGGSGVGDAPSQVAQHDVPASFLRIYEQVAAAIRTRAATMPIGVAWRTRR